MARERGTPAPCGLVCPSLGPLSPCACRGCPEPLPVTRFLPSTSRNTSDVQIPSYYISILYLSTISRLLVMSVISSGTPNNIRLPKHITHITLYRQRTLSVRTLRVRELCRHDRDTSPVNNQQWNLDSHTGSYIFDVHYATLFL